EDVELAIQCALALDNAFLFALHFGAPSPDLRLECLAVLDQLFLTGDYRALAQILGFALRFRHNALGGFFGGGLRSGLTPIFRRRARAASYKKQCRQGENSNAKRGNQRGHIHMDLCSTTAKAAERRVELLAI